MPEEPTLTPPREIQTLAEIVKNITEAEQRRPLLRLHVRDLAGAQLLKDTFDLAGRTSAGADVTVVIDDNIPHGHGMVESPTWGVSGSCTANELVSVLLAIIARHGDLTVGAWGRDTQEFFRGVAIEVVDFNDDQSGILISLSEAAKVDLSPTALGLLMDEPEEKTG